MIMIIIMIIMIMIIMMIIIIMIIINHNDLFVSHATIPGTRANSLPNLGA